ncbi:SDR family oxidoreductase [Paenarthrobacter sp. NPDC089675]|uniref:SDR family oxidoreductase n=1 Tax=Paenarthrobacter sp. NPDC089675 TaxID=3364376 RepID=UPI00380CB921
MELGIGGRTAIVLGAGSGIGRGVALALAAEGVRVACVSRTAANVEETVARIRQTGGTACDFVWDMNAVEDAHGLLSSVERCFGHADILFNNSGGPTRAAASSVRPQEWEQNFRSMFLSVVTLTQLVLPAMQAQKWGRIITTTSSGAVTPIPDLVVSNTLRSGMHSWAKTLATEVAAEGITVNVLVPGRIATERTRSIDTARAHQNRLSVREVETRSVQGIPAQRYGSVSEYAGAALFLASEPASYITGTMLRVDGGMAAHL